jgi:hypothetical protein
MRMKRLMKEGWKWRDGEKRLDDFWNGGEQEGSRNKTCKVEDEGGGKRREGPRTKRGYHSKELKEEQTSIIK